MGSINPIRRGSEPYTSETRQAKGSTRSAATAAKVNQIAQLPAGPQKGLRGRAVTPLDFASDLSKRIRRDWNTLNPEELAEKLIDLEERVAHLTETSPGVDKIKKQAEHLQFQFVFPVALELEPTSSGKLMPPSFAKTIYQFAKQVFQNQSLEAFQILSATQQREIIRIAARGEA